MDRDTRRKVEMVGSAAHFSERHPDSDAGHTVSEANLKAVRDGMAQAAALQRSGLIDAHTSTTEKRRIKEEALSGPIAHVVETAGLAAKDHPELVGKCRYKPSGDSYLAFLIAARSLLAEAQANKEVLAQYGQSDAVLEVFGQLLDQFEAALQLGRDGRGAHKGATEQLRALGKQGGQIVRAMDARNRYRFRNDPQLLAEWIDVSTVRGRPVAGAEADPNPVPAPEQQSTTQGGTPSAGGDVRPAA